VTPFTVYAPAPFVLTVGVAVPPAGVTTTCALEIPPPRVLATVPVTVPGGTECGPDDVLHPAHTVITASMRRGDHPMAFFMAPHRAVEIKRPQGYFPTLFFPLPRLALRPKACLRRPKSEFGPTGLIPTRCPWEH
jgi:hypothetical protein